VKPLGVVHNYYNVSGLLLVKKEIKMQHNNIADLKALYSQPIVAYDVCVYPKDNGMKPQIYHFTADNVTTALDLLKSSQITKKGVAYICPISRASQTELGHHSGKQHSGGLSALWDDADVHPIQTLSRTPRSRIGWLQVADLHLIEKDTDKRLLDLIDFKDDEESVCRVVENHSDSTTPSDSE
jgi:hypothetical protein